MTVFVLLKALSVFFQMMDVHYVKTTGSANGWNIVYYLFAGARGVMMFVIIALIGTGWAFLKPFLSDKDKKIFLVVIPLQILDNIALVVMDEASPGSQEWDTWRTIFKLVDLICCGAILVPIIWSIKHLREAADVDGKAATSLNKLQLFRQFYLMVVSYVYFTRILVYMVDMTLPFQLSWLATVLSEGATLAFIIVTGYKFRPQEKNPYTHVDEVELSSAPSATSLRRTADDA